MALTSAEFNALVQLLEDNDPEVRLAITARLQEMGSEAIPMLEAAWEKEGDESQQERIAEMIGQIHFRTHSRALIDWKSSAKQDLYTGWLLVTRIQFPDLPEQPYRNQLNRIIHRIWIDLQGKFHVPEKLLIVNRLLFNQERFQGNRKALFDPVSYYLNGLLDTKKGSPFSLSLLYLVVCNELDIPLSGVVMPGYCALKYDHPEQEFYVDVFNKGAFFTRADLDRYLESIHQEKHPEFFNSTSHVQMIRELILHLAAAHDKKKDAAKANLFRQLHQLLDNE